jgi:hypothetical protein
MKVNGKQMKMREHGIQLRIAISEVIDKVCEKHDFQIEYSVINATLCDIIRDNLGYEMKNIWKSEDEGDVC